ncbi:hypothetical protein RAJCM14343_1511 [Rhodococcus aetherivorans]|uniref:Uncharacterized protein n=1 Tax=Rhodococcus aetherivorans TaxID=191292 RepID=A0ABQ0YIH1_9NOCA|nr:hypothetical protein RAJCM14343_1511 [Rhodococcus aetherivorans]
MVDNSLRPSKANVAAFRAKIVNPRRVGTGRRPALIGRATRVSTFGQQD